MSTPIPKTIVEKIWDDHVVATGTDGAPDVIGIDLHLVHEVTSPQAFDGLRERGLGVRRPGQTVATLDHSIPTTDRILPIVDEIAARQVARWRRTRATFGIPLHGLGSPHQGIVHVIGPELGLTQPGMTIVCGDSHTATHGAFGALAFGIGTTEVEHVLATQSLLQRRPRPSRFASKAGCTRRHGQGHHPLAHGRIGIGGGERTRLRVPRLGDPRARMEGRMTICNMSIEGGARAGLVAPDDMTFEYVHGRAARAVRRRWDAAVARWRDAANRRRCRLRRSIAFDAPSSSRW